MSDVVELLDQALDATTFRTRGGESYARNDLCEALNRTRWGMEDTLDVLSARPEVDGQILSQLAAHLREQLSEYIDASTDRIGHSFPIVGSTDSSITTTEDCAVEISSSSSVSGFAKGLVLAAAVIGVDDAAELVCLWATEEPRHHKICVVLAGVSIDEEIELEHGLRIYRLPISSDLLPTEIPYGRLSGVDRILGHPVLEIDASTEPALFAPPQDDAPNVPLHTRTAIGGISPDTFFLALSLVCNQQVGLAWSWNDFAGAGAFAAGAYSAILGPGMPLDRLSGSYTLTSSTGVTRLSSFSPPPANLDEEGLRRAFGLRNELKQRLDSDQRFMIAVTRWARAALPGEINADRVVDLRIALEALYIDSDHGELGFRLSVTGARHLGVTLESRKAIRKSLGDFYNLASRVIHGTILRRTRDVSIVDTASKLCRDGIIKILEERHRPDWTELLLR